MKDCFLLSSACKENGCVFDRSETSEQPGVVERELIFFQRSIVGVVEKRNIIDGSKIKAGDVVLALTSSGIHTNGFSLIRKIIETAPKILDEPIEGHSFIKTSTYPAQMLLQLSERFIRKRMVSRFWRMLPVAG